MLALGVLGQVVRKLVGQGFGAPLLDTVEVRGAQLEPVLVRRYGAVTADRHGLGVDLALKGAGEVDGLQVLGPELGEHSVDRAFHAFLKTVENAHSHTFLFLTYPTQRREPP